MYTPYYFMVLYGTLWYAGFRTVFVLVVPSKLSWGCTLEIFVPQNSLNVLNPGTKQLWKGAFLAKNLPSSKKLSCRLPSQPPPLCQATMWSLHHRPPRPPWPSAWRSSRLSSWRRGARSKASSGLRASILPSPYSQAARPRKVRADFNLWQQFSHRLSKCHIFTRTKFEEKSFAPESVQFLAVLNLRQSSESDNIHPYNTLKNY